MKSGVRYLRIDMDGRPRLDGLFPDSEDHLELHFANIGRFVLGSMEIRIVLCGLSECLVKDDDWKAIGAID